MHAMRRFLPLALAAAFALASCGGRNVEVPGAEPTRTASSPAPTEPPSPEPSTTPAPTPHLEPAGLPATFPKDIPSGDLPLGRLVPLEALVTGTWYVPETAGTGEQVVIAYATGEDPDPLSVDHGLAVWQRYPDRPAWRAVYGFFDPAKREVLGIDVPMTGDLNGDGHEDLLTLEHTGGSGACGLWRALATDPSTGAMSELYAERACDTNVVIDRGDLVVTEAVFRPGDAHCCPSKQRSTTMRWTGDRWKVVDEEVVDTVTS